MPIILSVITVAIFFNLSVKPMDTATNVLGQKETMSQNKNSKKNTIGNAAQNNSNSKSIGSNTGNSSDESKSSSSGQTTTKDSSTVATTAPANTIKLSLLGIVSVQQTKMLLMRIVLMTLQRLRILHIFRES